MYITIIKKNIFPLKCIHLSMIHTNQTLFNIQLLSDIIKQMCVTLITDSLSHSIQPTRHPTCHTVSRYPEFPWQVISIEEIDTPDDMLDGEGERKSEAWRSTELLVCEAKFLYFKLQMAVCIYTSQKHNINES